MTSIEQDLRSLLQIMKLNVLGWSYAQFT